MFSKNSVMFVLFATMVLFALMLVNGGVNPQGKDITGNGPNGTPLAFSSCVPDPNCTSGKTNLQLCTLKCTQNVTQQPQTVIPPTCPPGTHVGPGNDEFCVPGTTTTQTPITYHPVPTTPPHFYGNCGGGLPCCPLDSATPSGTCSCVAGENPVDLTCNTDGTCSPEILLETGTYLPCKRICDDQRFAHGQKGRLLLCWAKPVIYLYPERTTEVSVAIETPGIIYKSIPLYPQGGWQHITARPDGTLIYQSKTYSELYYESAVSYPPSVTNGIIIPKSQLKNSLTDILFKLGLTAHEREEFFVYWLAKLQPLPGNYLLFSVLTPEDKERIDRVDITPKPETFIQFLAYFKPLDFPISINPLHLPENPPERKGFTAVEWGGTIDYH